MHGKPYRKSDVPSGKDDENCLVMPTAGKKTQPTQTSSAPYRAINILDLQNNTIYSKSQTSTSNVHFSRISLLEGKAKTFKAIFSVILDKRKIEATKAQFYCNKRTIG